jgi:hypothetical protein
MFAQTHAFEQFDGIGVQDLPRALARVDAIRWVNGTIHVARKDRHHDEWDRPVEAYDPYGPGVDEEDVSAFVTGNGNVVTYE